MAGSFQHRHNSIDCGERMYGWSRFLLSRQVEERGRGYSCEMKSISSTKTTSLHSGTNCLNLQEWKVCAAG